jgi:hypothetical protein
MRVGFEHLIDLERVQIMEVKVCDGIERSRPTSLIPTPKTNSPVLYCKSKTKLYYAKIANMQDNMIKTTLSTINVGAEQHEDNLTRWRQ